MSRSFYVVVLIVLLATAIYYPFSPGGRQRANMRQATQHIAVLNPQIVNDPRFRDVELLAYTGKGGSLAVFGSVATQADGDVLEAIVNESRPPCPVDFRVRVHPPTTTRSSDR